MRLTVAAPLALLIFFSTLVPFALQESIELNDFSQFATAKDPPCPATDVTNLPPVVNLANQSCLQVSLGTLTPGSIVSIDVSVAGGDADVLLFAANSVGTYLNDQSYRSDLIWESDASVESLTGDAEWHWEVPTDRSETDWYLILDNLAHSGDGGNGGQGVSQSNVTISVSFPTMSYWTLMDSLQVLAPGSHAALLGPSDLTLDAGTQVSVTAIPLSGMGDLFIMTEDQKETYLLGGGGAFWVPGTEILSISTAVTQPWIVPAELGGQPLYLFLDNEAGPTGGGDGSTALRVTVSVTLLPVLNPLLGSDDNLNDVDVGEQIGLNVNATPNFSGQVDLTQTEWDFDGDGSTDAAGSYVQTSFSSPGNRSVQATVHGPDGRTNSNTILVNVVDSSDPNAAILGSNVWLRDVDANFTLTSTSSDNWQIIREEWRVDGVLVSSFTFSPSEFTHSINTSGNHTVELTVVDGANNIDATSVTIVVRDGTKPVVGEISAENAVMAGNEMTFSVSATDPESELLRYNWDFDKEVDSDGDGIQGNDVQATGSTVSWTFSTAKPTYVTVTVTNDANISKTVQHLVDVEPDPNAVASGTSPLDSATPFIALIILVLLGGGGWFAWNRRKMGLEAEALALAQAEAAAEEEAQVEPERDDQLSMYAPAGSSGGYSGYGGGDSAIAALAGSEYRQGRTSSDSLSAFIDEEEAPTEEKEEILDDLDFLKKASKKSSTDEKQAEVPKPEPAIETKPNPTPQESGRVAKKSSGIALPSSAGGVSHVVSPSPSVNNEAKQKPASAPQVAQQQPQPIAAQPSTGQVKASLAEEGEPEPVPNVKTVKAACPACEQMFAVDMPIDVDSALVACPKCEQKIRLEK